MLASYRALYGALVTSWRASAGAAAHDRPRLAGRDDRRLPDRRRGDVGALAADHRGAHEPARARAPPGRRWRSIDRAPADRRLRGHGRAVGAGARRGVALHRRSPLRSAPRQHRGAVAARAGGGRWSASPVVGAVMMLVLHVPLLVASPARC